MIVYRRVVKISAVCRVLLAFILIQVLLSHQYVTAVALEKVSLQLAWKHQFQFAGYYAALHKGFYSKAGLDVTIIEGGEGLFAREAVLDGNAQYGVAGSELILHRAEGDPFVLLAAIFQHSASIILTRGDSNIAHPQDLIGKRLMILPENKDADILSIFQNEGIPMNLIRRVDQTYNLGDLIKGKVDAVSAYITNEPWYLEKAGIKPGIMLPQTYGVDFYSDCLFTTEKEIENNPGRVKRFREASLEGWVYAMDHQDEIIDLLINRYGVKKDRDHLRFEAKMMENLIFPKLVEMGHMNPGRWRHIADTFIKLGALDKRFDPEGFLYEPDPKPDIGKFKLAIFLLILGVLTATTIIFSFVRVNKRLKNEVFERKKSENRLQAILDASRAGIILGDDRGIITFANQGMADMFGCSVEELIGSGYLEHIYPDHRSVGNHKMRQLIDGELESIAIERRYLRYDGSDFWGFINARRQEDGAGRFVSLVGIISDITEIKKLEYELRQSHKMESIGTLAGGVAHDFNNILGIIIGNAELITDEIPEWNPIHPKLEAIRAASTRAAGIVKHLLNFSRKSGQELKNVDSVSLIRDALSFLRSTIPSTIEIRTSFPEEQIVILADPIQLNQVMLNICTNSYQAMEGRRDGIIEISVSEQFKESSESDVSDELKADNQPEYEHCLEIKIKDNGPGIASDIIDRIFDPYFTTKAIGKGSGMGLSIVHGIVKGHGGEISVQSREGEGASFILCFPVVKNRTVDEIRGTGGISRGSGKILFVDDEELVAEMTGEMLSRLGYDVDIKLNPVDALIHFQRDPAKFDLVITDMTMPQMTGVMLFEKLKSIREDIPVVICTGHSALIDEESALETGIAAYIMKPAGMEELSRVIRRVLDSKMISETV